MTPGSQTRRSQTWRPKTLGSQTRRSETRRPETPQPGPFEVRGTLEQVYVWRAPPDTPVELLAESGQVVAEAMTDAQGSLVFRAVPPGTGYTVRLRASPEATVEGVWVRSSEDFVPDPSL